MTPKPRKDVDESKSERRAIAASRQRYMGRGKKGRGALLDEVCEQFGYSRKHAINP
jgi:hypothetical protein